MIYLFLILFIFSVSSLVFWPIFYFIPTEKRMGYNQFFLVVLIFSILIMLVISPFMVIAEIYLLMILSLIAASVSLSGYLFSKTTTKNETKINGEILLKKNIEKDTSERFELSFKNKEVRVWFLIMIPTLIAGVLIALVTEIQPGFFPFMAWIIFYIWRYFYRRKQKKESSIT